MGRLVFALAAPKEVQACLAVLGVPALSPGNPPWIPISARANLDVLETGVGPAQAAGAIARYLTLNPESRVVNLGIAGALPGGGLNLLDVVLGQPSIFADLGVEAPEGFRDIASMGFGSTPSQVASAWTPDQGMLDALRLLGWACGPVATVSTCSGTDTRAAATAGRTGAVAEAMEGAAIAAVCERLGSPFIESRVISNTTGDRTRQRWVLVEALTRLGQVCAEVARVLGPQS